MDRSYLLLIIISGLCVSIVLKAEAQTESSANASVEPAYTVYRQINTSDYLPDEMDTAARYLRPRTKKAVPSKTEMNIPMGFAAISMLGLFVIFMYVIGLMLYDMSREDPVEVEEIADRLKS